MKRWTDSEMTLLRERYAQDGAASIAASIGRSAQAVRNKAQRHGMYRPGASFLRWTRDELQIVRSFYRRHGAAWTAKKLGRTWKAVARQAQRMGAASREMWTREEETALRDGYAAGARASELSARLWRSGNALRKKARRMGLVRHETHSATRLNARTSDEREAGATGVAATPQNALRGQIDGKNGVHDECAECERRRMCAVASPERCKYARSKGENHG